MLFSKSELLVGKSTRKGVAVLSLGKYTGYANTYLVRNSAPEYVLCDCDECARATTGQPRTLQLIALG